MTKTDKYYYGMKQKLHKKEYRWYWFGDKQYLFSRYGGFVPPSMKDSVDRMNDICKKYFAIWHEMVFFLEDDEMEDIAAKIVIDCHIEVIKAIYEVMEEFCHSYDKLDRKPGESEAEHELRTVGMDKTITSEVVDDFIKYGRKLSGEVEETVDIAIKLAEDPYNWKI